MFQKGEPALFSVFTDLRTAVEWSERPPSLGPIESGGQWPTSVSGFGSTAPTALRYGRCTSVHTFLIAAAAERSLFVARAAEQAAHPNSGPRRRPGIAPIYLERDLYDDD